MARSRLKRGLELKTTHHLILMGIGAVVLIIIFIIFVIPALINTSLFLAQTKQTKSQADTTEAAYIAPPELNIPYTATNSGKITVEGSSDTKGTISLYVNDRMVNQTTTKHDKSFRFTTVPLKDGDNTIKAKVTTEDNKDSVYSDTERVTYISKQPTLSIDYPNDGQHIDKEQNPITIRGKTDPGVKITINSFWATVDGNGDFSYTVKLQNGDNKIQVTASDEAGNQLQKEISVNYSE